MTDHDLDMLEFLRTGYFEPLGVAPHRHVIANHLGPAVGVTDTTWAYGALQFRFAGDRAVNIQYDSSLQPTTVIHANVLAENPTMSDVRAQLTEHGIDFDELEDADAPTLFVFGSNIFLTFDFDGRLADAFKHYDHIGGAR